MKRAMLPMLAAMAVLAAPQARADDSLYRITITNVTHGQVLTPPLVFSHGKRVAPFFVPGEAPSAALEQLAEGGNTAPLLAELEASGSLQDSVQGGDLIPPGASASFEIEAKGGRFGLAAMLLPTNDGFVGAFGIERPRGRRTVTVTLPAMDAGSELNDESCDSIPGPPPCGGEAVSAAGGEGYVHVHSGIHGVGDLLPEESDWRNPVARITIERARR